MVSTSLLTCRGHRLTHEQSLLTLRLTIVGSVVPWAVRRVSVRCPRDVLGVSLVCWWGVPGGLMGCSLGRPLGVGGAPEGAPMDYPCELSGVFAFDNFVGKGCFHEDCCVDQVYGNLDLLFYLASSYQDLRLQFSKNLPIRQKFSQCR